MHWDVYEHCLTPTKSRVWVGGGEGSCILVCFLTFELMSCNTPTYLPIMAISLQWPINSVPRVTIVENKVKLYIVKFYLVNHKLQRLIKVDNRRWRGLVVRVLDL